MSRLLLVRHGVTESNTQRRFSGHSDADLNTEGYRQAEKLGNRLAEVKIDVAFSSDLKRALTTAEIICAKHEINIMSGPDLREFNYGIAEGMTYQEIAERYPELGESISRYNYELAFPDGESFEELYSRADSFIKRVNNHSEDHTVLIVSHGGMLRTLLCKLLTLEHKHWSKFRIDNASLTIIETYPNRNILNLFNDISHLAG